jgi:hypothetical protein
MKGFDYSMVDVMQITSAQFNTARKQTMLVKGKASNWLQLRSFLFTENSRIFLFIKYDNKFFTGEIMEPYFDPSQFKGVVVTKARTITRLYVDKLPEFEDNRATA